MPFQNKQFQEGSYTNEFTTEWRAEMRAWPCYQWTADVCRTAGICILNFQSTWASGMYFFLKAYCCQSPLLESLNTTPQNYLAVRTNSIPYEGKVRNKHIAFLSCYLYFDLIRKLLKTVILVKKTSERFLNLEMCICRVQKETRKLSYISRMLLSFFFFFY